MSEVGVLIDQANNHCANQEGVSDNDRGVDDRTYDGSEKKFTATAQ